MNLDLLVWNHLVLVLLLDRLLYFWLLIIGLSRLFVKRLFFFNIAIDGLIFLHVFFALIILIGRFLLGFTFFICRVNHFWLLVQVIHLLT